MFSKISHFDPVCYHFSSKRFEDSFHSYSSTSSDFFDCTNGWVSSEYTTETSDSSIESMRAALNEILIKDIFESHKERAQCGSSSRKLTDVCLGKVKRRNGFYIRSDDSSRTNSSDSSSIIWHDFVDDFLDMSPRDIVARPLHRIKRSKTRRNAVCRSPIVCQTLKMKFSEHTSPSSGMGLLPPILRPKRASIPIRNDQTVTVFGFLSKERPCCVLPLRPECSEENGFSGISRNFLVNAKLETSHLLNHLVNEILNDLINKVEKSKQTDDGDNAPDNANPSEQNEKKVPTCSTRHFIARKSSRNIPQVRSRESECLVNRLYGFAVSDPKEQQNRLCGQCKEGNDTIMVPYQVEHNDSDVEFNAMVQLIVREFHRRVKPVMHFFTYEISS